MRKGLWLLWLAIAACGDPIDEAGFVVDGKVIVNGVHLQDGTYRWQEIVPPTLGGAVYALGAASESEIWAFGRDIVRWKDGALTRHPLEAAGVPGPPDLDHYAETFALLSPTDLWVCGSALWHFDGTAWTEKTSLLPGAVAEPDARHFNRCEVATDGTTTFVSWQTIKDRRFDTYPHHTPFSFEGPWLARLDGGAVVPVAGKAGKLNASLLVGQGKLHSVGVGHVDTTTGAVTPGLKGNLSSLWSNDGGRVVALGIGMVGGGYGLYEASAPGDFLQVEELPMELFDFINHKGQSPTSLNVTPVQAAVSPDGGVTALFHSRDLRGSFALLAQIDAEGRRVLSDRLYGHHPVRLTHAGDRVVVASEGGAVLLGSPR